MTEEQKSLLLKDLCARLLHKPTLGICVDPNELITALRKFDGIKLDKWSLDLEEMGVEFGFESWIPLSYVKPYLRPLSSMTEKEEKEWSHVIDIGLDALATSQGHTVKSAASAAFEMDFYNKHHFDYRGLIPMGLALEAPKDMYKIE